ncbi:MAG: hypothetical protein AB7F74_02395 [Parvibaculaceae bacterium]
MRRALAIAASVALMLAAGETALTQTPNLQPQPRLQMQIQPKFQVQPKLQQRAQQPTRPPNLPLIKPSQAIIIAQRFVPNSKAVGVKLLPGGNYAVTLKRSDRVVQRVIVEGDTGTPR